MATALEHPPHDDKISKGKDPEGQPAGVQPAEGTSSADNSPRISQQNNTPDVPNGRARSSTDREPSPSKPSESEQHPAPSSADVASSSRAQDAPSSSLPASSSKADEGDRAKDAEKDKASLNTTLTGTHTHTQSQSGTRRKDDKNASDGAHTATEETARPKSPSKRSTSSKKRSRKQSLFSRLFHVFLPCVGPSRAHDIDVPAAGPSAPAQAPQPSTSQEKQTEKPVDDVPPEPSQKEAPASTSTQLEQSTEDQAPSQQESIPAPLQQIEIPTSSDPDVVVPPTPTKSLPPEEETHGMTSGGVVPPGSTGLPEEQQHEQQPTQSQDSENESDGSTSYTEDEDLDDNSRMDDIEDDEERLILQGGAGIPIGPDGTPRPLLPPVAPKHAGRKCLVLDLDETLVHSSFKSISQADYVVPVEIEYHWHNVYVIKRPGVDNFLKKMGEIYEIVVFTASLSKYADPVLDKLDIHHVVSHRLFRESCYNHRGNYVKDLSQLGRPIQDTIIIDNSPASYIFHPNNAVPVSSWFTDPHDQELSDLCPFLTDLATVDDVRGVLDGGL